MRFIFIIFILSSCAGTRYQSPEDYYYKRQNQLREDSINWGPNSNNNNMLDSQDGSTYYNRDVEIIGVKY